MGRPLEGDRAAAHLERVTFGRIRELAQASHVIPSRAQNTFGLILHSNADGTRPAATMGTAVTPGTNAYGSYATLLAGASVTDDVYEIEICVNNVGISTQARDAVVSIGLDPSGGTSFTSIVDLVSGPANSYSLAGSGSFFRFPLFIAAGTSIGAAAAVNSSTLTAVGVFCRLKCRPSRPDGLLVGQYIDQFGVTLASSAGTAITTGTTTEGAWTQLGAALTRPCWFWELGFGLNNATMSSNNLDVDVHLGDAINKNPIIANHPIGVTSAEVINKPWAGTYGKGSVGDIVYARVQQGANAALSGMSMAVYGVGG
jgi:hypothetical protein